MNRELAPVDPSAAVLTKAGLESTKQQLQLLEDFVQDVLRKDEDYGVIPGTGTKSTLLKPGAANIMAAFNCHAEPYVESFVLDPVGKFVSYEHRVDVVNNASGKVVSMGYGACNSHEVKYHYRELKRTCPNCGASAIIKGREQYGGGWVCWRRQGGCGTNFKDGDETIEDQQAGRVENEDPLDQANTILKMSIKRAEVDAAMRLPGVARFFTQDLDDFAEESGPTQDAKKAAKKAA